MQMIIEPVYRALVSEDEGEWGEGELMGYRVVSKLTGAVLGFGETRDEALAEAHWKMFPVA